MLQSWFHFDRSLQEWPPLEAKVHGVEKGPHPSRLLRQNLSRGQTEKETVQTRFTISLDADDKNLKFLKFLLDALTAL
mgnify:CR=1 FL=1